MKKLLLILFVLSTLLFISIGIYELNVGISKFTADLLFYSECLALITGSILFIVVMREEPDYDATGLANWYNKQLNWDEDNYYPDRD